MSTPMRSTSRPTGRLWRGGPWRHEAASDPFGTRPAIRTRNLVNTGGEGGDCSGFTFKVWRESTNQSDAGFYQWNMLRYVHGPYTAAGFKGGTGAPNVTLSKSAAIRMDAFASSSHIGMIYAKNANGTDEIIEAKGEAYGTNIWTRTYRGDSSYSGVRRSGWSS
ncbi:MAG: hypothetical protein E6G28_03135 [Actinobacteria bacterium]|nr:MAG: hypothetical protein E6G28_03135 [Actinomycetota bacterium]